MSEPKCKFFVCLAMHDIILTTSNMVKQNWPCNHNCALCLCIHETTDHLLTQCNFIEATWNLVANRFGLPGYDSMSSSRGGPMGTWWSTPVPKGEENKAGNNVHVLVDDMERAESMNFWRQAFLTYSSSGSEPGGVQAAIVHLFLKKR
jgi:hypothetical protein